MKKPASSAPKRKADEELRGTATKSPRLDGLTNGAGRPGGDTAKASRYPTDKPLATGSSGAKSASVPRTSSQATSVMRNGNHATPSKQRPATSSSITNGSRSVPVRPPAKRPSPVQSGPKPEPKKRSFAEIMARAAAAQSAGPSLGKIQHKPLERPPSKKEREEMKAEEARKAKAAAKQGTMRNGAKATQDRGGPRQRSGSTSPKGPAGRKTGKAPVVEVKKVKKAALATTGYTGTARPRPGAASSKAKDASSTSNSASRSRPQDNRRYGGVL